MNQVTIKISLETYQELALRKIDTGVPIATQVERLVLGKPKKKGKK